jgi:uncharacterized protein involved in exopolysaccharide biosynthesis
MKSATIREFLAVIFRHRSLVVFCFCGIFLGALLAVISRPREYQSQMQILVKRERIDPIISSQQNYVPTYVSDVTEEIINSEVAILKGEDLMRKVAQMAGLADDPYLSTNLTPEQKLATAGQILAGQLQVEPLRRTNLIRVVYESPDPKQTIKVLSALGGLYLDKHLAVHRPTGTFEFFQNQAVHYKEELDQLEKALLAFNLQQNLSIIEPERENILRRMLDFDFNYREAVSTLEGTETRIKTLEAILKDTQERQTTQVRISDNPFLHDHLKSELSTLELRRTELLTRFDPSYRLIQEVDKKIGQIKATIKEADTVQLRDETTDRNPNYDWVRTELNRARAELSTLQGKVKASHQQISEYQKMLNRLEQNAADQLRLTRSVKLTEENYLLYTRKAEEARISDAMDRQRIVNVSIAEPATQPRPSSPLRTYVLLMAGLLATLVSLAAAYLADYFDPTFRTPDEVELFLNVPILAVIQKDPR